MKRLGLALVLVLVMVMVMAGMAQAAPYLVCDPYVGAIPDHFEIIMDGGLS